MTAARTCSHCRSAVLAGVVWCRFELVARGCAASLGVRLPPVTHRLGNVCCLDSHCKWPLPMRCCQQHYSACNTARMASLYRLRLTLNHSKG